jgi:hypothetical protein
VQAVLGLKDRNLRPGPDLPSGYINTFYIILCWIVLLASIFDSALAAKKSGPYFSIDCSSRPKYPAKPTCDVKRKDCPNLVQSCPLVSLARLHPSPPPRRRRRRRRKRRCSTSTCSAPTRAATQTLFASPSAVGSPPSSSSTRSSPSTRHGAKVLAQSVRLRPLSSLPCPRLLPHRLVSDSEASSCCRAVRAG